MALRGLVTIGPRQSATSFLASKDSFGAAGINLDLVGYRLDVLRHPIQSLRGDVGLMRALREPYDFVILNSGAALFYRPRLFRALIQACREKGCPTFLLWRNAKMKFSELRAALSARQYEMTACAIRDADLQHLCISQQTGREVAEELAIPAPRCVYNCPNVPAGYGDPVAPADPPIVLSVGSIGERKNPKLFLEVARLVRAVNPTVRFVWVGARPTRELESAIRGGGLQDAVEFVAFAEDPYPYMQRASVLFLTSREEAFGLVLAEAMACYRSVMCLAGTGAAEVGGDPSCVMPQNEPQQAAEKILEIVGKPAADRIDYTARRRYESMFAPQAYATRFASIIRDRLR